MSRWKAYLEGTAATFEIFDYAKLVRDDGKLIKDFRDCLRIDMASVESTSPGADWKNVKDMIKTFQRGNTMTNAHARTLGLGDAAGVPVFANHAAAQNNGVGRGQQN
jgi:hypothetical protein